MRTFVNSLPDPHSLKQEIAQALQCGRPGCTCSKGNQVHCPVPGHGQGRGDQNPSLSITARDGLVLLKCHAGCRQGAIIQALRDCGLWPTPEDRSRQPARPRHAKIAAIYDYRDETGSLLFQVVREEPKAFKQRRPDGRSTWIWNLDGVRRVLYRLPELLAAPMDAVVHVVEGEKDADALAALGLVATTNPEGAGKWRPEFTEVLRDRVVVILADNDEAGRHHVQHVAQALHSVAASMKIVQLPGLPEKGDVSDWLGAGGTRELFKQLVAQTPEWMPQSVPDLALVLDECVALLRRCVVLGSAQADVEALFIAHSYVFGAAEATPILYITSPEKSSGKTRNLETLERLVQRPWLTGRVSPAVLYRKTEAVCPTLLLDEVDAALKSGEEYAEALRGVLDSGHRRGGKVSACVGQGANMTYQDFSTFCPKVLAGLDRGLPETVRHRAITIQLRRRLRNSEPIMRWRYREIEAMAGPIRDKLQAWAAGAVENLRNAHPSIPEELDDRAADYWEPLLAIADLAGGPWPERARRAALELSTGQAAEDDSLGIRLLTNIRTVFDRIGENRIASAKLVEELRADQEAPWATYGKAERGLTASSLATLLRRFDIRSTSVRLSETSTPKGYYRKDFEDAWRRYCDSTPSSIAGSETQQLQQSSANAGFGDVSDPQQGGPVADAKMPQTPRPGRVVAAVADRKLSGDGETTTTERITRASCPSGQYRCQFCAREIPVTQPARQVRVCADGPPVENVLLCEQCWQTYQGAIRHRIVLVRTVALDELS